jgi:hypothetical protein
MGKPISKTDPLGLQQFPIPTSGQSGVQQAGAQAMACALNPAACNPRPVCTCRANQLSSSAPVPAPLLSHLGEGAHSGLGGWRISWRELPTAQATGALGGLVVADCMGGAWLVSP